MVRTAIMTALVICASFSLAACGGDDISQAELERERADAAQNARQEAEIKALQRELKSKESSGATGTNSGAPPSPAQTPVSGEIPSDARYCGSAYGAGSASCPFVENVSSDYYANGESGSFTSYSPTTELTYTVTCNGDDPTVCTAGRAAVIYIP